MIAKEAVSSRSESASTTFLPVVPRALPRSHVIERFREAVAELGAPDAHEIFVANGWLISCASCFEAGVRDLGLRLERLAPHRATAAIFEPYEEHTWCAGPRSLGAPHRVEALSISRHGLVRLGVDSSAVWLAQ